MLFQLTHFCQAQWICISSIAYGVNYWVRQTCGCCKDQGHDGKLVVKVEDN